MGAQVFASQKGSLPEILADNAFYFDSFEPEKMAATVKARTGKSEGCGEDEATCRDILLRHIYQQVYFSVQAVARDGVIVVTGMLKMYYYLFIKRKKVHVRLA